MRKFVTFGPGLLILAVAFGVLILGPLALRRVQTAQLSARVLQAQHRLEVAAMPDPATMTARLVADAVLPGVVHIETENPFGNPTEAAEGEGEANEPPRRQRMRRPAVSSGAGWVWNNSGVIITNAHVIGESADVKVELYDGRVRRATVLGTDPNTDIGVLKIDVADTIGLSRASQEPIFVGDRVFAFGSPFGIKFSMSQGIVSGLGRGGDAAGLVGMRAGYTNFIQTDAAMNPGNSGGPIVDARGRVVGMATAIANNISQQSGPFGTPLQGQSAGIGFAIPLETVESIVEQLLEDKLVLRGYLGLSPSRNLPDGEDLMARFGYEGAGALIDSVVPDQPAWKAGLRGGDIIVSVEGRPTPTFDILRSIVSIKKPGTTLAFTYWRDGQLREMPVTIGAAYVTGEGLRAGLSYIPGSETMTIAQAREVVRRELSGEKPATD